MRVIAVLLLTSALALDCIAARVVGGQDADGKGYEHLVSIQSNAFGPMEHVCGGSIIARQWILTAGHCITDLPHNGQVQVIAGINNLNENFRGQTIRVTSKIVHPNYVGGATPNDIGLLKLARSLVYNSRVLPIALPKIDQVFAGECVLSGWGSISYSNTAIKPTTLQTANVSLLSYEECDQALVALLGSSNPLDRTNICTGPLTGGPSACRGDSGGPLFQNGIVVGVVSWGLFPCGRIGAPSIYTKVSSFRSFLSLYL